MVINLSLHSKGGFGRHTTGIGAITFGHYYSRLPQKNKFSKEGGNKETDHPILQKRVCITSYDPQGWIKPSRDSIYTF